jgi:hypothetical protein
MNQPFDLSYDVFGRVLTYEMTTPKGNSSGGIFFRLFNRWVMVWAVFQLVL